MLSPAHYNVGTDCLNVWFPAHWAPIVLRELHSREEAYRKTHKLWFDDPQDSDPLRVIDQRKDALRSRKLHFHIGAIDGNKNQPTLIGKLKIDWLGCLSSKLLVPGMAVAPRRPR